MRDAWPFLRSRRQIEVPSLELEEEIAFVIAALELNSITDMYCYIHRHAEIEIMTMMMIVSCISSKKQA